ncbi:PTS sugar transporter subunit IIA, partial [Sharpea azabuensis]
KSVDENEIALIALHLGAAYERKITNDKYRVITIIPHNVVLANACLEKIKKHFDDRIDIVDNFKLVDEVKINLLSPDLIISTIPINTKLKAPIVEIKLFFDYEDESMIMRTLDTLERQKNQKEFIALLKRVIRKDYCYFGYDFQTKEECIAYLCNELVKKGIAPEGYEQDVLKRENISSTSFVQGFAVPHSLTVKTTKQYISLMTLKHPIQWGQFEVGLVILMGINNDDSELIRIFFEWLTHIVTNPEMISKLFSTKSYDELMKNIKEDI